MLPPLWGDFSPAGYQQELKKMLEYSCVDYRRFLSREDVLRLYRAIDIGIATIINVGRYNTCDNFATKIYEYMSMGLPVILSCYLYVEMIFEKYKFSIAVNPPNIDEIANAIRYIIDTIPKLLRHWVKTADGRF